MPLRRYNRPVLCLALVAALLPRCDARILNVPDEFQNIWQAVDAANNGDIVILQPDTYLEQVDFEGKNITIASRYYYTQDPLDIRQTVLNGDDADHTVVFRNRENESAVLLGVTVTGGNHPWGGGIYVRESTPTIRNVVLFGNRATIVADEGGNGGAVYVTLNGHANLINVTIVNNSAERGGGAIYTFGEATASLTNCIVWNNGENPIFNVENITFRYSDVEINVGGVGNINQNPRFADINRNNYSLLENSPCIDRGDPNAEREPDGTRVDMGGLRYQTEPLLFFEPEDSLDFGELLAEETRIRHFNIVNEGINDLEVADIALDPEDAPYEFIDLELPIVVEQGNLYSVRLEFAPQQEGIYRALVMMETNAPACPEPAYPLYGVGLPRLPELTFLADSVHFPAVTLLRSDDLNLTIANVGVANLILTNPRFEGPAAEWLSVDLDDTLLIRPNRVGVITVEVVPRAPGYNFADLILDANHPQDSTAQIRVSVVCDMPARHYEFAAQTGHSQSILVEDARLDGEPLTIADEIAAFTPGGLCCGSGQWLEDRIGFAVWANDIMTEEVDGFEEGERVILRVWDYETELEAVATVNYLQGDSLFRSESLSRVVLDARLPVHWTLVLDEGWSMISLPLWFRDRDVSRMFAPLIDRGSLRLMKNTLGRFIFPEHNFNNLPPWEFLEGYLISMVEADELTFVGEMIPPDTVISLSPGWHIVSYFPEWEAEAPDAFVGIVDHLGIAKDDGGGFYVPERDFNAMAPLRRGEGYQVFVNDDVELVWGEPQNRQAVVRLAMSAPRHFRPVSRTGANMSLLLYDDNSTDFPPYVGSGGVRGGRFGERQRQKIALPPLSPPREPGGSVWTGAEPRPAGELGVFAAGMCVGAVVLQGDAPWGLPIWGDDPTTPWLEGASEGAELECRLWQAGQEQAITIDWLEGFSNYHTDALAVGQLSEPFILYPLSFILLEAYPNPFNSSTTIRFVLPQAGRVSLSLYDPLGRKVRDLIPGGWMGAGEHTVRIRMEDLPSGVFGLQLQSNKGKAIKPITILK